ncbi:antitoxin [Calidifontibacter sp. DB0510]|uniref:Antitoxin n=1 Tax=Metallococcus carri TaxID=1656884 RepID=A0A967AZS9_9MICO|nr:antitoxin [Metallococcus carri]NHN54778.1 antitoxin [Metallococcus carri]NOP37123.1 antitoxin [Calidifontibacter sp. DB2511S]
MATLYIRDVDPDVAKRLKARAAAEGISLSAYVATALTRLAASPSNAELVERLQRLDRRDLPTGDDVVRTVREGRR